MTVKKPSPHSPPPGLTWKARPIFISSTFRDMHAERDYLRGHGFLRLAEQLRERCHYLDTIDLRQGVESPSEADEAAREMQVLKVCLDEIERCKPFFIGLIGDRYGWVPPSDRIRAAAQDAGLPPSLDVAGRSVTELEVLYGVLENPDQRGRSWFYFRTLDRSGMPPEVAARFPAEAPSDDPHSPAGRLRALKEQLRRQLPDRVREYVLRWDRKKQRLVGLAELDAAVERDLWSDLDAETTAYLRAAPKTWQEADARAVWDFVAERTRGYVERPAVTDPMLNHGLSPAAPDASWGLVVTGESGCGKSSLFGRAYEALQPRAAAGELVLLSHAAGIFPLSGQVDRMLKRWVTELASSLGLPDPLDQPSVPDASQLGRVSAQGTAESPGITSERIDQAFAELLHRVASERRVVVVIDALNQFEPTDRAEYLTWLPKPWPDNARLLATAVPCQATAALAERDGCRELPTPPVTSEEAREIARRFYRERHHRDVNAHVLDALEAKSTAEGRPAHGNPLWLALALQEMNLLEADDYERAEREHPHLSGAARLQALQLDEAAELPGDVPGMYDELLARAGRGFGPAWVDSLAGLIAISRAGWRESDLRHLMPGVSGQAWDDLAFAGVRRALGTHIVQRGNQAQWDFFHAALREAVLRRGLAQESTRRYLHGLIADHLQSLAHEDPLRISESMFHLIGLGDRDRAASHLAEAVQQQWSNAAALSGAVSAMVEAIQACLGDEERDRLTIWIAELMGGDEDLRAGRVANAIIFDLSTDLAITGSVQTERPRKRLLAAAQVRLEELHQRNPQSADYARDLCVSCWRMALNAEETGRGNARVWWRKAFELLNGMKLRGIMPPTDEQFLAALREKVEGSTAG
ncbi:MAG: DUF4062 domain-containing protein [Candidatus Eisenbacteria bacterium]|nr:DUF4062 domain-containing protein [Candidatus Eisenbacteria bacterium]